MLCLPPPLKHHHHANRPQTEIRGPAGKASVPCGTRPHTHTRPHTQGWVPFINTQMLLES